MQTVPELTVNDWINIGFILFMILVLLTIVMVIIIRFVFAAKEVLQPKRTEHRTFKPLKNAVDYGCEGICHRCDNKICDPERTALINKQLQQGKSTINI